MMQTTTHRDGIYTTPGEDGPIQWACECVDCLADGPTQASAVVVAAELAGGAVAINAQRRRAARIASAFAATADDEAF